MKFNYTFLTTITQATGTAGPMELMCVRTALMRIFFINVQYEHLYVEKRFEKVCYCNHSLFYTLIYTNERNRMKAVSLLRASELIDPVLRVQF